MKLLPEGFRALLAPAVMLPAALPRPDAPPMVPARRSSRFSKSISLMTNPGEKSMTSRSGLIARRWLH